MTSAVILAGGKATRLDGAFKPLLEIGTRCVLNYQLDRFKGMDVTLEGPEGLHGTMAVRFPLVRFVPAADGGPVAGLRNVLEHIDPTDGLIVAYSDTLWFDEYPKARDWCGVNWAPGGRPWDVLMRPCEYGRWDVPEGMSTEACIGLYRFSDMDRLREACDRVLQEEMGEAHMWQVCNMLRTPPHTIDWLDVGDWASLTKVRAAMAP